MPIFKVWWPEQGQTQDDATEVKAFDHEDAASRWADWYDNHSAEYAIVGGHRASVKVIGEGDAEAKALVVIGYQTRQYTTRPANG